MQVVMKCVLKKVNVDVMPLNVWGLLSLNKFMISAKCSRHCLCDSK